MIGVQAWMRAIFGLNPIAFLPEAISWVMARDGSVGGAKIFMWTTKWWAHIWGWIGTFLLLVGLCIALLVSD